MCVLWGRQTRNTHKCIHACVYVFTTHDDDGGDGGDDVIMYSGALRDLTMVVMVVTVVMVVMVL